MPEFPADEADLYRSTCSTCISVWALISFRFAATNERLEPSLLVQLQSYLTQANPWQITSEFLAYQKGSFRHDCRSEGITGVRPTFIVPFVANVMTSPVSEFKIRTEKPDAFVAANICEC